MTKPRETHLRIPPAMMEEIQAAAQAKGVTIKSEISQLLHEALSARTRQTTEPKPAQGTGEALSIPEGFVSAFAAEYDFRFDNGAGYEPTEAERSMLEDFGNGLLTALTEQKG